MKNYNCSSLTFTDMFALKATLSPALMMEYMGIDALKASTVPRAQVWKCPVSLGCLAPPMEPVSASLAQQALPADVPPQWNQSSALKVRQGGDFI